MLAPMQKPLSRTFLVEGAYETILENILSARCRAAPSSAKCPSRRN
jgi:hypothetical protein